MNAKPKTELNISVFMQKRSRVNGALASPSTVGIPNEANCRDAIYLQPYCETSKCLAANAPIKTSHILLLFLNLLQRSLAHVCNRSSIEGVFRAGRQSANWL